MKEKCVNQRRHNYLLVPELYFLSSGKGWEALKVRLGVGMGWLGMTSERLWHWNWDVKDD